MMSIPREKTPGAVPSPESGGFYEART